MWGALEDRRQKFHRLYGFVEQMRILISVVLRSWEFQITKLNWGLNFHIYWIYISLNIWISTLWKVCIQKWWIAGDIFHWTGWKWALMETIMLLMFLLCFHTFYSFAAQFGHKHISSPLPHIAHCKAFPFPKTAHGGQPKHPVDPDPIWQQYGTPCNQTSWLPFTICNIDYIFTICNIEHTRPT